MRRRDFVKISGVTVAGLGLTACEKASASSETLTYQPHGEVNADAEARQIVFIMTDTMRWDMVGHVNQDMKTPYLDRMAANGMRIDLAYSCSPVCGPARSAIFTGTYPHTNGVWGNNLGLADNVRTIGERLTDNGFHYKDLYQALCIDETSSRVPSPQHSLPMPLPVNRWTIA